MISKYKSCFLLFLIRLKIFDSVFLESKIDQEYNRGWKKYIKKECVMMIISVIFAVAYFLLVALVAALVFRAIGKIFELFDGYLMYH